MIFTVLVSLALAQDPLDLPVSEGAPITVRQLEDVDAWARQGRAMVDGPPGCVQVRGQAQVRVVVYRPGGLWGAAEQREILTHGPFSGTLEDGVWTHLESELSTEGQGDSIDMDSLYPMIGRHPEPGGDDGETHGSVGIGSSRQGTTVAVESSQVQALSMIDAILQDLDPEVTTSYATWDSEARVLTLTEQVPLDSSIGGGEAELRLRFPEAGPPTALDLVFPERLAIRQSGLQAKILNAQVHLRAQTTELGLVPARDSTSLVMGVLGQTFGVEQHLAYTGVRACP